MYRSIDSSRVRNLKLLAQLKVGDKLCTRYHHYTIDPYDTFSIRALTRFWNGESRTETIDSVTQLIEGCILQHGINAEEKKRLGNEFRGVVKGMNNLMVTYRGDKTSCVGIQLVKEMMEEYIESYADKEQEEEMMILHQPITDVDVDVDVDDQHI